MGSRKKRTTRGGKPSSSHKGKSATLGSRDVERTAAKPEGSDSKLGPDPLVFGNETPRADSAAIPAGSHKGAKTGSCSESKRAEGMTAENRRSLVTKIANPHRMGPADARPAGNREIASNEKGDGGGLGIEMEVIAMEMLFQGLANSAQS